MGRGKSRSARDLPKPIDPKGRKMIGFGLLLMGFATSAFTPSATRVWLNPSYDP
jgi:hypothetical protein